MDSDVSMWRWKISFFVNQIKDTTPSERHFICPDRDCNKEFLDLDRVVVHFGVYHRIVQRLAFTTVMRRDAQRLAFTTIMKRDARDYDNLLQKVERLKNELKRQGDSKEEMRKTLEEAKGSDDCEEDFEEMKNLLQKFSFDMSFKLQTQLNKNKKKKDKTQGEDFRVKDEPGWAAE